MDMTVSAAHKISISPVKTVSSQS